VPFAALAVLLGVWPGLVMRWLDPSVAGWVENLAALKL